MKKLHRLQIRITKNIQQRWGVPVRRQKTDYSVRQLELLVRSMNLQRMP